MSYVLRNDTDGKSQHKNDSSQVEVDPVSEDSGINHQDHHVEAQELDDTKEVNQHETDTRNYILARDRQRRIIKPPARFGHADLIHFALTIAEEVDFQEPSTYKEAVS